MSVLFLAMMKGLDFPCYQKCLEKSIYICVCVYVCVYIYMCVCVCVCVCVYISLTVVFQILD